MDKRLVRSLVNTFPPPLPLRIIRLTKCDACENYRKRVIHRRARAESVFIPRINDPPEFRTDERRYFVSRPEFPLRSSFIVRRCSDIVHGMLIFHRSFVMLQR